MCRVLCKVFSVNCTVCIVQKQCIMKNMKYGIIGRLPPCPPLDVIFFSKILITWGLSTARSKTLLYRSSRAHSIRYPLLGSATMMYSTIFQGLTVQLFIRYICRAYGPMLLIWFFSLKKLVNQSGLFVNKVAKILCKKRQKVIN